MDAVVAFLRGFIWPFLKSLFKTRKQIAARQDKGAADQREADRKADDEITAEARGSAEKIRDASDEDIDTRLNRWRRGGSL